MRSGPVPPAFIAGVLAVAALAVFTLAACGSKGSNVNPSGSERAIDEAQAAFSQAQSSGIDLNTGPCISESLPSLPDWVGDIAHDPRQPVDDQPANQCQRYRDGQAHHFVELAPDGQLIRAE
jgi:predicted small lipoprotein YifL